MIKKALTIDAKDFREFGLEHNLEMHCDYVKFRDFYTDHISAGKLRLPTPREVAMGMIFEGSEGNMAGSFCYVNRGIVCHPKSRRLFITEHPFILDNFERTMELHESEKFCYLDDNQFTRFAAMRRNGTAIPIKYNDSLPVSSETYQWMFGDIAQKFSKDNDIREIFWDFDDVQKFNEAKKPFANLLYIGYQQNHRLYVGTNLFLTSVDIQWGVKEK